MVDRAAKVAAVVESLERDMELLCLTGVEDRLQQDVRPTLEMLRNAGIKVRSESHKKRIRTLKHSIYRVGITASLMLSLKCKSFLIVLQRACLDKSAM